jgi:hypothetical protein
MPETLAETARRRQESAVSGRVQAGEILPLRQGYSVGTEPAPPVRQYGGSTAAPAAPPPAGGLTKGYISSAEQERRRRAKAAAGIPLGQEELN